MYDRKLIDYLPKVLQEITEYKTLNNDVLDPEITLMWRSKDDVFNDQFIDSMTENGVKRWEKIIGIIPKGDLTLDERKFTIITKLNEELPFTKRVLEERLLSLCGKDNFLIELRENEYYIKVLIGLKAKNNYNDVVNLLNRRLLLNILLFDHNDCHILRYKE